MNSRMLGSGKVHLDDLLSEGKTIQRTQHSPQYVDKNKGEKKHQRHGSLFIFSKCTSYKQIKEEERVVFFVYRTPSCRVKIQP